MSLAVLSAGRFTSTTWRGALLRVLPPRLGSGRARLCYCQRPSRAGCVGRCSLTLRCLWLAAAGPPSVSTWQPFYGGAKVSSCWSCRGCHQSKTEIGFALLRYAHCWHRRPTPHLVAGTANPTDHLPDSTSRVGVRFGGGSLLAWHQRHGVGWRQHSPPWRNGLLESVHGSVPDGPRLPALSTRFATAPRSGAAGETRWRPLSTSWPSNHLTPQQQDQR